MKKLLTVSALAVLLSGCVVRPPVQSAVTPAPVVINQAPEQPNNVLTFICGDKVVDLVSNAKNEFIGANVGGQEFSTDPDVTKSPNDGGIMKMFYAAEKSKQYLFGFAYQRRFLHAYIIRIADNKMGWEKDCKPAQ